ncbi:MAG TPA: Crp/Fnr family transcriptional regulator [Caulobacteraceae bacterium]
MDIAAVPWFAGLEPALRADLIARGRQRRAAAGEWLHGEGDEDAGLIAVLEGALRLYSQAPGGREVLLGVLPAGTMIGQSAVLGGGPRLVTAIAASDSRVFLLSDRALREVAASHPMLWRPLSQLVYGQLRAALQGWAEMVGLGPRERMISRLLLMSGGGSAPLTQAALAEMVGVTRKAVNGWLRALEAEGLVALGYGRITVRDRRALERMLAD